MKNKTNEEKRHSGTLRPSNAKKEIDANFIEIPVPSDVLNKNSYRIYYEICTRLNSEGRLREVDCVLIEILASSIDEYYRSIDELERGELVITTASGHSMPNCYIAIKNAALNNIVKISKEFGLTPASLAKLPEIKQTKKGSSLIK